MGNCCIYFCVQNPSKLENLQNDIDLFSLHGRTFDAKVVDVYDGDTCSVVISLFNTFTKFRVRCAGYDSPEMKPLKSEKNRDITIIKACKARNYFASRTTNCEFDINIAYSTKEMKSILEQNTKVIKMKCEGWDKYGRLLGHFYVDGEYINEEMIQKNFGYKYNGGTKKKEINIIEEQTNLNDPIVSIYEREPWDEDNFY